MKYMALLIGLLLIGCTGPTEVITEDNGVGSYQSAALLPNIGVMGCSNTQQKALGARNNFPEYDQILWRQDLIEDMDKGDLGSWGDPNSQKHNILWNVLATGFDEYPTTNIIVWELCLSVRAIVNTQTCNGDRRCDPVAPLDEEIAWADYAIQKFESLYGNQASLYISGLNQYVSPCKQTGGNGPSRSQQIVDYLVDYRAQQGFNSVGPVFGNPPLASNELERDGCHLNAQGQQRMGEILVNFLNGN